MKRTLLLLGLALAAGSALYAMEGVDKMAKMQEEFRTKKQAILQDMDARLKALQKSRECISAATDHEGLKRCFEEEQSAMKAMHQAKKQEQLKEIEEQQKKLERRKQELLNEQEKKEPEKKQ